MYEDHSENLQLLRAEIAACGLDGFIVPMADRFMNEFVPPSDQRVKFVTGFTGSSGEAVVLLDKAAFFTDGRYELQSKEQVSGKDFDRFVVDAPEGSPLRGSKSEWLKKYARKGAKIGFDPWLHTAEEIEGLRKILDDAGIELVPIDDNPVDAIWADRPEPPMTVVSEHAPEYAGESSFNKRSHVAHVLNRRKLDAAVLTDPASVAWLLNIRGRDIADTPLALSFAIIDNTRKVQWFIDPRKIKPNQERLEWLLKPDLELHPIEEFPKALAALGGKKVLIDAEKTSFGLEKTLKDAGVDVMRGMDPVALPRACKNRTEQQGARNAHLRDGVAVTRFLAWLDENAPKGTVSERSAAEKLEEFRRAGKLYVSPSFSTIAGSGPHGAIIHYGEHTDEPLVQNSFFLVDSGAQYHDGTTDITRTILVGDATPEMKKHFTLVLQANIRLAMAEFGRDIRGYELDKIARSVLDNEKLEYIHGTGHGVGSFLGCHEGPQRIAGKGAPRAERAMFRPGMIVSDEPGVYLEGKYGIRTENLLLIKSLDDDGKMGFEALTLAPIDRRAIDLEILSDGEKAWLNQYHAQVGEKIASVIAAEPSMTRDEKAKVRIWLAKAVAPV
jgi:Xaa-Pro aminopeptidase